MAITTSGVGSGIDIRQLVDDMLAAEGKAKTVSLQNRELSVLSKITGFGSVKGALSEFQTKLAPLKNINAFQGRLAVSADKEVFTVSAQPSAALGSYLVEVTQLAKKHKVSSADFASADTAIGTGTIRFQVGSKQHSMDITSSNQTLKGIMNKINDTSATTGISAAIITSDTGSRLVFTALEEGADQVFTVSVVGDADSDNDDNAGLSRLKSDHLTILETGLNSIVNIDGSPVTTSGNTVTDAIEGVTINLLSLNAGEPSSLSISEDRSATIKAIESFVEGYNNVITTINEQTRVNKSDKNLSGALVGDATLRNLDIQLRRALSDMVQTIPGGVQTLAEIGITTDALSGKLTISQVKLGNALNTQSNNIAKLFAKEDQGIAIRLDEMIDKYITASGVIDTKTQGLNSTIDTINQQREQLERNLQNLEQRLVSQFIAMDSVVAGLRSTSDFLSQQLSKLPSPLSYKN